MRVRRVVKDKILKKKRSPVLSIPVVSVGLLNTKFNLQSSSIPSRLLFLLDAAAGSVLDKQQAVFYLGRCSDGGAGREA